MSTNAACRHPRFLIVGLCLTLSLCVGTGRCSGSGVSVTGEVKRVADAVGRCELARALALRAVDNAWAANGEAGTALLKGLPSGDSARVRTLAQRMRDAWKDTEKALSMAEQIVQCAERCLQASAALQAMTISDSAVAEKNRDAKDAKRLADLAEKEADDAAELAQELKQKWLIPPPPPAAERSQSDHGESVKRGA
jgi:hypothetical protein